MQLIAWIEDEEGIHQLTEIYPKKGRRISLGDLIDQLEDQPDEIVKVVINREVDEDGAGRVTIAGDNWIIEGVYTYLADVDNLARLEAFRRRRQPPKYGLIYRT